MGPRGDWDNMFTHKATKGEGVGGDTAVDTYVTCER